MNIFTSLIKFLAYTPPEHEEHFSLKDKEEQAVYDVRHRVNAENTVKISKNIDDNFEYMKKRFSYPDNADVVLRKITLRGDVRGFLAFYEGMTDTHVINESITKALLELPVFENEEDYAAETVMQSLIIHSQVKKSNDFQTIIDDINFGGCGIFIDGISEAFSADVKNWPHRSVEKPENEQSIYGPQEAFAEMLRGNSAQVRKFLKTEKLICEQITVGKVTKTAGVMMYLSDVANTDLVDEARRRINGVSVDYIFAVEELGMMIEDNPLMITQHLLATERPDRVARELSEGRVAVILTGSPRALVLPTNAYELTHAAADAYLRTDFANMSRIIRFISTFISVLLPGLFIAITMFHEEMLPTYLLYAISASRQNVPFPSIAELLLMEISFELIREAGVRMPGPLGSILGIVGGLILGQAAVSAKIVSPIMIIIVAITGIGSFATADYALGWSYRILKFVFIILGGGFGFFGIAIGVFLYSVAIAGTSSFGVPFLSPMPGKGLYRNALLVPPIWKSEKRPYYLNPKLKWKEDKLSKKWTARK